MKNNEKRILLYGKSIDLALFSESVIPEYFQLSATVSEMGEFWPLSDIRSPEVLAERVRKDSYFGDDSGRLLICEKSGRIVGCVIYFKPVFFWQAMEIGYRVFSKADWGKGFATETVKLLAAFLFEKYNPTRMQITCHPDNEMSKKVAMKAGFQFEGILRNTYISRGKPISSAIYSLLPSECPSLSSLLK
jgi:ribosomal-protein-alanine N-acetyltransferase